MILAANQYANQYPGITQAMNSSVEQYLAKYPGLQQALSQYDSSLGRNLVNTPAVPQVNDPVLAQQAQQWNPTYVNSYGPTDAFGYGTADGNMFLTGTGKPTGPMTPGQGGYGSSGNGWFSQPKQPANASVDQWNQWARQGLVTPMSGQQGRTSVATGGGGTSSGLQPTAEGGMPSQYNVGGQSQMSQYTPYLRRVSTLSPAQYKVAGDMNSEIEANWKTGQDQINQGLTPVEQSLLTQSQSQLPTMLDNPRWQALAAPLKTQFDQTLHDQLMPMFANAGGLANTRMGQTAGNLAVQNQQNLNSMFAGYGVQNERLNQQNLPQQAALAQQLQMAPYARATAAMTPEWERMQRVVFPWLNTQMSGYVQDYQKKAV